MRLSKTLTCALSRAILRSSGKLAAERPNTMARTLVRVALKFAGAIVIVWLAAQVGFWFFLYNFTLFEPPIAVALVPSAIVGCAAAVFLFRTFPIWRFRARATAAPAAHTLGTAAQGSRRRLRFSLRTLLLIVGLCAVLASWFPITAAHDRTESAALSRINEAGGKEKGWKDFAHLRRVTALSFSPFWGPTDVFKDNTLQDLLPILGSCAT